MSRRKLIIIGIGFAFAVVGYVLYWRSFEGVTMQETVFKRSYTFDDSVVQRLTFTINGSPAFSGVVEMQEGQELDISGELEATPESGLMQGGDGALKPISGMLVCRPPGSNDWDTLEVQKRDVMVTVLPTGKKRLASIGSKGFKTPPAGEYEMRLIVNFGKHPLSDLTSYWLATGKLVVRPTSTGNL